MKFLFILGPLLITACGNPIKSDRKVEIEQVESTVDSPFNLVLEPRVITDSKIVATKEDLIGYWVGDFEAFNNEKTVVHNNSDLLPRLINLAIDSLTKDSVFGHSVVVGNRRPFSGTYYLKDSAYWFVTSEPGNDKFDGKFEFSIQLRDSVLKGTWIANEKLKVSRRSFGLKKRKFVYNPELALNDIFLDFSKKKKEKYVEDKDVYYEESMLSSTELIFDYNPSTKIIEKADLENLSKGDIIVLRNLIYARHGYAFKSKALRSYFEELDWYFPVFTDIRDKLTKIEKENIKGLLRYEKHAEAYYDYFGR